MVRAVAKGQVCFKWNGESKRQQDYFHKGATWAGHERF